MTTIVGRLFWISERVVTRTSNGRKTPVIAAGVSGITVLYDACRVSVRPILCDSGRDCELASAIDQGPASNFDQ
jgi:hypothetical protein